MDENLAGCLDRIEDKLDRVLAWIDRMESPARRDNEDMRNFAINLIADIAVDRFGNRNNNNNQIFYR